MLEIAVICDDTCGSQSSQTLPISYFVSTVAMLRSSIREVERCQATRSTIIGSQSLREFQFRYRRLSRTTRHRGGVERCGCAAGRAGPAHRQEARPQTGRHAATPHRPNPPSRLPRRVGGEAIGEIADDLERRTSPSTSLPELIECISIRIEDIDIRRASRIICRDDSVQLGRPCKCSSTDERFCSATASVMASRTSVECSNHDVDVCTQRIHVVFACQIDNVYV